MTTGRPGAAHICLPYDLQKQEIDPADVWAQPGHDRYPAMRSRPHPADVEQAAEKLVAAKCPVIVCGGGVVLAGACAMLETLATMLNAPVCTTVSGKGTLADSHPLNAGVVGTNGGVARHARGGDAGGPRASSWALAPAPPPRSTGSTRRATCPSCTSTSTRMTIGTNYRTDVALVGDALLALADLNEAVRARLKHRPADAADGRAIAGKARARKLADFAALAASTDTPIKPERVVDSLNRHLPPGAIVVADPGTPCPYFSAYFDAPQAGRHFITNRAHGALGFAMSAGVGAQFGRPDAMVVAAMGDGSFNFTCGELETIVRRGVPLKMVVFSNTVYGWIKASQKTGYGERYFSVDFNRTDHARVAEAFGVKSWRVEDPGRRRRRHQGRARPRRPRAGGRDLAAAAGHRRAREPVDGLTLSQFRTGDLP